MLITTYAVELEDGRSILVKEKAVRYSTEYLTSPEIAANLMNDIYRLNFMAEEFVYLIAMNVKCKPIGIFLISKGSVSNSEVNPRDIFVRLLLCGAARFILMHNHPSGDPTPSQSDINITKRILEGGNLIGVKLLDHIIVGAETRYYSMRENGYID